MQTESILPVMQRVFPEVFRGTGPQPKKRRTIPSPSHEDLLSSSRTAAKIGATLRQLQWWDERHLVSPRQINHKRGYTPEDIARLRIITRLRAQGFSLNKSRKLLNSAAFQPGEYRYILTDGKRSFHANSIQGAFNLMLTARKPLVLIDRGAA